MRKGTTASSRCWTTVCVAAALFGLSAGAAHPGHVDVVSQDVTLESGKDGSQSGTVTVMNSGSKPMELRASIGGQEHCTVGVDPATVDPGRRTVELTFPSGCDPSDGVVTLELSTEG